MNRQKRIVAIHDISCAGRCSLTVALPIISSVGIETNIIPTAVLSTQTGDLEGYTFKDLTDQIMPIANHWKSLDRTFEAIYTGYLGSFEQIDLVKQIFLMFGNEVCLKFVDPVMADHGVLYDGFDFDFVKGMKDLCGQADIITPNITEAVFMLGEEYIEGPYTDEYINSLLHKLGSICKKVIVTGIDFTDNCYGAASYNVEEGVFQYAKSEKVHGKFHGTGDVFASCLIAALLSDIPMYDSMKMAVDFTVESIKRTKESKSDVRFGINFEAGIFDFVKRIRNFNPGNPF
ncbi:MAG TPA: pyridoxamine kinase [Clostridia bacterium]|jgi:pyridoxine kinase|nr:pyridoxamine kinase [Clostridiaceae bacterium]HPZ52883.1 pyridoxamine kinase [Clostridia bacterium]